MTKPVLLDWLKPTFHATYARMIAAMLRSQGGDPGQVLAQAGWSHDRLQNADEFVPFDIIRRLVLAVMKLQKTIFNSLDVGGATPPSAHGALGTAIATAPTLGDAIPLLCRFVSLRCTAFAVKPIGSHGFAVEDSIDFGVWRMTMIDALASLLKRSFESITGEPLHDIEIRFPYPAPYDRSDHDNRLGKRVFFGAPRLEIILPDSVASMPAIAHDPTTHATAHRECERALALLQGDRDRNLATLVRNRLAQTPAMPPRLGDMAADLGLTPRTLIRRLQRQETSYQAILDGTRVELAEWYLRQTGESVEAIAVRLGYQDPSNFSRTFRRWKGMTPSAFRESA
jgi:AraC-like DNA-binding protein